MKKILAPSFFVFLVFVTLPACSSTPPAYEGAFDQSQAPGGAPQSMNGNQEVVFKAAKWVLVKQGFQIQKFDLTSGTVTAERDYVDPEDKHKSYLIDVIVAVQDGVKKGTSSVAISATQNTLLHTKEHTWWHLLWIFPIIPTGTVYQTVNTGEGSVTDKAFYSNFYKQIKEQVNS